MSSEPPFISADELAALRDAINGPELDLWIDRQIERVESEDDDEDAGD